VDYFGGEDRALTELFLSHGVEVKNLAQVINDYKIINKKIWGELEDGNKTVDQLRNERFERLKKNHEIAAPSSTLETEYKEHFVEFTALYPGVEQCLKEVKTIGITIYIVSNGFSDTQARRIYKLGIGSLIDEVITTDDTGKAKPDTSMIHLALERSQTESRNTWLVGDSLESDIQAANRTGIRSCWINGEHSLEEFTENLRPSIIANSFVDFINYFLEVRRISSLNTRRTLRVIHLDGFPRSSILIG
jgi:HAD superfamily hydrolase (TIGR01549 family)